MRNHTHKKNASSRLAPLPSILLVLLFVRSEQVPDIVTSADVKQLDNVGHPQPRHQPAPPDVGGQDQNVGNQPVQGMPNIDHHGFVGQHSVPGK